MVTALPTPPLAMANGNENASLSSSFDADVRVMPHPPNIPRRNTTRRSQQLHIKRADDDQVKAKECLPSVVDVPSEVTDDVLVSRASDDVLKWLDVDALITSDDLKAFGAAAEPIGELLHGTRSLTLPAVELHARDLRALCFAAARGGELVTMNLADTGAGKEPDCLAHLVRHAPHLCTLDVTSTGLTDQGAKVLADGLRDTRALQHLYVGFNELRDDGGAAALVVAALQTSTMRSLDLSSNPLGDEGCAQVAHAVASTDAPMSTFESLHMNHVGAGPRGSMAMASAFAPPAGTHRLHVHGASGEPSVAFEQTLRVNLASLSFAGNQPGAEASEALRRAADTSSPEQCLLEGRHFVRKRLQLSEEVASTEMSEVENA